MKEFFARVVTIKDFAIKLRQNIIGGVTRHLGILKAEMSHDHGDSYREDKYGQLYLFGGK